MRDRLVAAPRQLLGQQSGHPGQLVGGKRDPHLSHPRASARPLRPGPVPGTSGAAGRRRRARRERQRRGDGPGEPRWGDRRRSARISTPGPCRAIHGALMKIARSGAAGETGDVDVCLEARDLPPEGVALGGHVHQAEVLAVEHDQPRARAEHRPAARRELAQRLAQPLALDAERDRRRLPAGDHEPVESLQVRRHAHLAGLGAEPPRASARAPRTRPAARGPRSAPGLPAAGADAGGASGRTSVSALSISGRVVQNDAGHFAARRTLAQAKGLDLLSACEAPAQKIKTRSAPTSRAGPGAARRRASSSRGSPSPGRVRARPPRRGRRPASGSWPRRSPARAAPGPRT